jgi:hypothetical protein
MGLEEHLRAAKPDYIYKDFAEFANEVAQKGFS